MSTPPPIITLTTDFGQTDHYVAQMKGVILGLAPQTPIVDVTHEIPPQDVHRAGHLIADLADAFPSETIHVAVIDPGVGSERKVIAVRAEGQFYIAPDNGLLSLVFNRRRVDDVVSIENERFRRQTVTATFHGRDIMAPAAAHLANGVSIEELGPRLERPVRRSFGPVPSVFFEKKIVGSVAWIDRFGNLVTNIQGELLREWDRSRVRVSIGAHSVCVLRRYYAEAPAGEALLLIGSSGKLEIAINGGSAADLLKVSAGTLLTVEQADG